MSDVFAIFGTLLMLAIVFPGLLTACWLLFPNKVERARGRVEQTPGRSFWVGLVATFIIALPILTLFALPVEAGTVAGLVFLAGALAFALVGAAGIAAEMGCRLQKRSQNDMSTSASFVRGAIVLELAAAFPLIGWFVVIPLATITAVGATVLALLGRQKQKAPAAPPDLSPAQV